MGESELFEQLEAVQRGLRRSGREMVLSSSQALVRGVCVCAGTGATLALSGHPWWHVAGAWGGVAVVCVAIELAMYVRLVRSDPRKFVTGVERQLLKMLVLVAIAGLALTGVLVERDAAELVPGTWLLMAGLGYSAVGLFSFSRTWVLGVASLAGGAIALWLDAEYALMVLGAVLGVGSILWSVALRFGGQRRG